MSGFYIPATHPSQSSVTSSLPTPSLLDMERMQARANYERDLGALIRLLEYPELWDKRSQAGCELEMVLVDRNSMRPVDRIDGVLASYKAQAAREPHEGALAPRLGAELLRSNIEADTAPLPLGPGFFNQIERQLHTAYKTALTHAAQDHPDTTVLLAGIAPTYLPEDFASTAGLSGPVEGRFHKMNGYLMGLRGGRCQIKFGDVDLTVENMTIEGATTSFQLALSAHPDQFISKHHAALLAMGYTLAISTNAPFLNGMRGWHESRIGLLQSGICPERFCFKSRYDSSPAALFGDLGEYEFLPLFKGEKVGVSSHHESDERVPSLNGLVETNRTVWKWMRPCYGVGDDMPHLRLEMRGLPAGPTVTDMVANAAFYYGLVFGIEKRFSAEALREFSEQTAESNFQLAAQHGPQSTLTAPSGKSLNLTDLVLGELISIAREGLELLGVEADEFEKHLSVIAARASSGQTGSDWMCRRMQQLLSEGHSEHKASQLMAKEMHQYQLMDLMSGSFEVSRWPI